MALVKHFQRNAHPQQIIQAIIDDGCVVLD